MAVETIRIDGRTYRVRTVYGTRQRSFQIISGQNAGTSLSQRQIRDIRGTGYTFTMQFEADPAYPTEYDLFYEKITEPVEYHTVTVPYGQTTMTFQAAVVSGTDQDMGIIGGKRRYSKLTVTFSYMQPQRSV